MTTGLVWHERYMWHMTGMAAGTAAAGGYVEPDLMHVESPPAKRRIRNLLEVTGLIDSLHAIRPREATEEEVLRVHTSDYIASLREMSRVGYGEAGDYAPVGRNSYEIALLAAGGCIAAADAIVDGIVSNSYALVRPPGHHAERHRGRGFCLLANVPVTIEHLRTRGLTRFALVDWDVHHGNGAQSIYYEDPNVLTISLHQDGNYPAESGSMAEVGAGKGEGSNINVPLPAGSGHGAYLAAIERVALPALEKFRPDIVIVPSGFDGCAFDPLGRQMAMSETFREMTRLMMQATATLCGGRLLLTHEGGYSPFYAPWCGLAVMEQLSGIRTDAEDPYGYAAAWPGQTLQPHQAAVVDRAAELVATIPV